MHHKHLLKKISASAKKYGKKKYQHQPKNIIGHALFNTLSIKH